MSSKYVAIPNTHYSHIHMWLNKYQTKNKLIYFCKYLIRNGFGGLGVSCWPLVPKFAGSNPAEAVGFLGRKILSMPSFGGEVKP